MTAAPPGSDGSRGRTLIAALLIAMVTVAAYLTSFDGVFVFDDTRHIVQNPRITDLSDLSAVLGGRRPVVNLSLAVNHALGGLAPRGYHVFNLGVHVLAALALFAIVRRTLLLPALNRRCASSALITATAVALIWAVHPLQTQSVTYLIQRAESTMGLFYLLTLYCVLRGAQSEHARRWYAGAVVACALGMGSKAVMITAPVVILVYDRVFLSTSWREIMRRRGALYLALAGTWTVLLFTGVVRGIFFAPDQARAAVGFNVDQFTPWTYLLQQPAVVLMYLRLSIWPDQLCLDHALPLQTLATVAWPAAAIGLLGALTILALRFRPGLGFLGVAFFVILAPTSSFIPVRDPIFEHRMYLPLAAISVLVVLAIDFAFRRLTANPAALRAVRITAIVLVAAPLVWLTLQRNKVYHSRIALWSDVVNKYPQGVRGHTNLGAAYLDAAQPDAAADQFRLALALDPEDPHATLGLGNVMLQRGDFTGASVAYARVVKLDPDTPAARNNFAIALLNAGRVDEAIEQCREAIRLSPDTPSFHFLLASACERKGDADAAGAAYRQVMRIDPENVLARVQLAKLLAVHGSVPEAIGLLEDALRLDAAHAEARRALDRLRGNGPS